MSPAPPPALARGLAAAMLGGEWTERAVARRVTQAVGGRGPRAWVLPLVRSVRGNYAEAPVDRPLELAGFLAAQPPYGDAGAKRVRVTRHRPAAAGMARSRWPVPAAARRGCPRQLA